MLEENLAQWKKQYTDQVRQKVLQEAREKAREEARQEAFRLALRSLLEARFGSLPDSVSSFIDNYSDSDALKKCILYAPRAESLQAVIDQFKVMTGSDCNGQTIQPA